METGESRSGVVCTHQRHLTSVIGGKLDLGHGIVARRKKKQHLVAIKRFCGAAGV